MTQPIKGVRFPRLSLAAGRSPGSAELDGATVKPRGEPPSLVPPYTEWPDTLAYLRQNWTVGQHMALVARTRSGKTTAARRMLALRDWVVVFGTKERDSDLYDALEAQGYVTKPSWEPSDLSANRVILKPPLGEGRDEDFAHQREVFRRALIGLFRSGGWTLYLDEVRYIAVDLGLRTELDRLWLQGGALGVTIVAATQRPRSVPLNMFEQSSWIGAWRISDREDRDRAAMMMGPLRGVAMETMEILPRYEFLLVDLIDDHAFRTKVT